MKTEHIVLIVVVVVILFVIWNNRCNEGYDTDYDAITTTPGSPVSCNELTGLSWNAPVPAGTENSISSMSMYVIDSSNLSGASVAKSVYDCFGNDNSVVVCEDESYQGKIDCIRYDATSTSNKNMLVSGFQSSADNSEFAVVSS